MSDVFGNNPRTGRSGERFAAGAIGRKGRWWGGLAVVMTAMGSAGIRAEQRATTPVDRVAAFNPALDRDDPRALPMKIRALRLDEYRFFCGFAAGFYRLCAELTPEWTRDRSTDVILHGDVHIGNVGTYQGGGPGGRDIHFGIVDLDETVEGPFQLDLLRGLTAIRFAARAAGKPLDEAGAKRTSRAICDGYLDTLSGGVGVAELTKRHPAVAALLKKAAKNDARKYAERFAVLDGQPRFRSVRLKGGAPSDLLDRIEGAEREQVLNAIKDYYTEGCDSAMRDRFRFGSADELVAAVDDVARWTRLGSSGSQGVRKYLALITNDPLKGETGPLILELKEEPPPAALAAGHLAAARGGIERAMEVATAYGKLLDPSPRLIGCTRIGDRGFLVRQKDPWNEDLDADDFNIARSTDGVVEAAAVLGGAVGLAHRRGLMAKGQDDRISLIVAKVHELPDVISSLSGAVEERLRREFELLRGDERARELARKAEDHVAEIVRNMQR